MQFTADNAQARNKLLAAQINLLNHFTKIPLSKCNDDPHIYYTYAKEDHNTVIMLCAKLIESLIGLEAISKPRGGGFAKDALWRRIVEQAEALRAAK